MGMRAMGPFIRTVEAATSTDDLAMAMVDLCAILGFEYFALTHHVDLPSPSGADIRLHNYPEQWAAYYDAQALGVSDPVHRASHVTSLGFPWSRIHAMITLTPRDRQVLALGAEQGIGDGFTVPANIPGETFGSCTFANTAGRPLPEAMLPLAQWAGLFAFEGARRLWSTRKLDAKAPVLTDRQRDCILWAARGKGDWEISRILGLSEETVARHIKQACARYGVNKRTLVAIRALFDGTLTFTDILKR